MSTALVTGASAGIGRAIALRLVMAGWNVVAVGRREQRLTELRDAHAEQVRTVVVDIRDTDGVLCGVAALPEPFNAIDLLVNNAAMVQRTPMLETSREEIYEIVDTNVRALVGLTSGLLQGLVERRGAIINISSTGGVYPAGRAVVYNSSKAFASHFAMSLRTDLHGTGVRCTVVEPGYAATEMMNISATLPPEQRVAFLDPDDVAEVVVSIAELPPHVNVNRIEVVPIGQTFGGWNRSWS